MKRKDPGEAGPVDKWPEFLTGEDLAFIKRFVVASGSLKEMARVYGISYPTVRLRLDRLIEKIKLLDSQEIRSPFERVIRASYADGKIDMETMKTLLAAHRDDRENRHDVPGDRT